VERLYVVRKRYGSEERDVREFVDPQTPAVTDIASALPADREAYVRRAWEWVVRNIDYPPGPSSLADRHYQEAFLASSGLTGLVRRTVVAAGLGSLVRGVLSGGSTRELLKGAFLGGGLAALAQELLSRGTAAAVAPARCDETNDFWQFPSETVSLGMGDCEDMSFLLCSILRHRLGPDEAYVTLGTFQGFGHAWVTIDGPMPLLLETTLDDIPRESLYEDGPYRPVLRFNDQNVVEIDRPVWVSGGGDDPRKYVAIWQYHGLIDSAWP